MSEHAVLSPSSAHRWLRCPASIALEAPFGRGESSVHADEGTAAHELAERCLRTDTDTSDHEGVNFNGFIVGDEMIEHVQTYLDVVRDFHSGTAGPLLVEQKLPIWHITGEVGARGTTDALVISPEQREIIVIDLKYGKGVHVSADDNEQLMLYALGAIEEYGLMYDIQTIRLVISQPRISKVPSEWTISREALDEWGMQASDRAALTSDPQAEAVPGTKQCHWCKAKVSCKALEAHVMETIAGQFVNLDEDIKPVISSAMVAIQKDTIERIARVLPNIDLIEEFCKSVRARAEATLLQGKEVPGYKLVRGKKGNRAWSDETSAVEVFKSMRLKIEEMYDLKLISPTRAEKLLADTPRRWNRVSALVTQADGKPTVVPASDKREALVVPNVEDAFDNLDSSDLL